jgi:hypothetical protein
MIDQNLIQLTRAQKPRGQETETADPRRAAGIGGPESAMLLTRQSPLHICFHCTPCLVGTFKRLRTNELHCRTP